MTQITQNKTEKDGLHHKDAGKSPLVQEGLKIVQKRSLSKQVESKTAEMCGVIEERWEKEVGHLRGMLEQYEAKVIEHDDKIEQASGELAQLDNLIRVCEHKITAFSSELATRLSLVNERQDKFGKLYYDYHDTLLLTRHLEEEISSLRLAKAYMRDQLEEREDSTEELSHESVESRCCNGEPEKSVEELEQELKKLEDRMEDRVHDRKVLCSKLYRLSDRMSEHRYYVRELSSESAELDFQIRECKATLERYRNEKSWHHEHKTELQEWNIYFKQQQKEVGDRITNRQLEIGEEIREAYKLAKEEVEISANS